ncbi:MAG TPA: MFS transporter [Gemmatimonadaceae bacterium]|nr:MFS transporter [Gemmatimonadaceae bacterium]
MTVPAPPQSSETAALPEPGSAPSRSLNPFRALQKHRNFRIFWGGQTLSLIGTWMQSVAQGWLALELTDDPFMVGLVVAVGSIPVLLFSLWAGVLADRVDKLRIVFVAQALLLVQATLLWWFVWTGQIGIGLLIGLATAGGIVNAVEIPSRQAMVIELVGREDLLDAIALNSSGFNLARIIGPSLAAIVIARLGLAWCFALNALSYLAVLLSLFRIRLPPRVRASQAVTPLEGLRQGLVYMRSTRDVAVLMRLTAAFSVLGVPYLTLLPVFARDILDLGATGYGTLLTFVGLGALAGALSLAAVGRRVRRGRLLAIGAHSFAAIIVVFSLVSHPTAAAALLLLAGYAMITTNALTNGLLQSIVPDDLRGRVMAAYTFVFVGLSPLGSLLGGAVASAAGVRWAIGGGGAIMLAFAAWAFWRYPEIRRL